MFSFYFSRCNTKNTMLANFFRNSADGKVSASTQFNISPECKIEWDAAQRKQILFEFHFLRSSHIFVDCNLCILGSRQQCRQSAESAGHLSQTQYISMLDAYTEQWTRSMVGARNEFQTEIVRTGKCDAK